MQTRRRLPLTDREREIVMLLNAAINKSLTDPDIRKRIARQPWIETIMVSVASARGTVSLSGIVASIAQRDALRALAEEVDGVRKVDLKGLVVDRRAIALKHSPVTPMV